MQFHSCNIFLPSVTLMIAVIICIWLMKTNSYQCMFLIMFNLNPNHSLTTTQSSAGGNEFYLCSSNCAWPVTVAWPHPHNKIKWIHRDLTCYLWLPITSKIQIWETLYSVVHVIIQNRSVMEISHILHRPSYSAWWLPHPKSDFFSFTRFLDTHCIGASASKGNGKTFHFHLPS